MPARQGARHHLARLTPEQVIEMRRLYAQGGWSFMRLVDLYDYVVEPKTLREAVRGVTWAHLPGAVPLTTK